MADMINSYISFKRFIVGSMWVVFYKFAHDKCKAIHLFFELF